ncbi:hypothetical protein C8034_v003108 [Colletotrichum sidae]|uniref:Uncharacterized protein n=1 Tax=Colletotrichum sidae TaxID=1347389 RepID=A0A4R8TAU5_9PEZI|nr:hypothetical protein C8034_v003108 [Colletotrichum sidae]
MSDTTMRRRGPRQKDVTPKDLIDFKATRLELQWNVPAAHLNDEFFGHHFRTIASSLRHVVEKLFEKGSRDFDDSPWKGKNAYLEKFIDQIARPDPLDAAPWDDLLKCPMKRTAVLRGAILRIIADTVLNDYLVGAEEDETKILREQDENLITDDDFRRTKMRQETVDMFLSHHQGVPPNFWPYVDKHTMKILVVILPIWNWVRRTWPAEKKIPDIKMAYELLHHSVAYACWFAVNVRRSPSVLTFDWPAPGERYTPAQVEVYPAVHSASKVANTENDFRAVLEASATNRPAQATQRTARVMVAVVPKVDMFSVVDGQHGYNIFRLLDARVVSYHGLRAAYRPHIRLPLIQVS